MPPALTPAGARAAPGAAVRAPEDGEMIAELSDAESKLITVRAPARPRPDCGAQRRVPTFSPAVGRPFVTPLLSPCACYVQVLSTAISMLQSLMAKITARMTSKPAGAEDADLEKLRSNSGG